MSVVRLSQMCLIAILHPSNSRLVHPPPHDARQTSVRVNAFVGVVPDHLQPRRLTTLLSNLRPSDPLASTLQVHFTWLSLSDSRKPVFPSYSLTLPRTVFFSIWPSHSFGTTSTIFNFVFFSQERAPSALAAVGNICSPYTLFITLVSSFLFPPHLPTVVAQRRYNLDTFFQLQATLSATHVSAHMHLVPCLP
jgi:hypothetical protein